jgi:hypothetical protein
MEKKAQLAAAALAAATAPPARCRAAALPACRLLPHARAPPAFSPAAARCWWLPRRLFAAASIWTMTVLPVPAPSHCLHAVRAACWYCPIPTISLRSLHLFPFSHSFVCSLPTVPTHLHTILWFSALVYGDCGRCLCGFLHHAGRTRTLCCALELDLAWTDGYLCSSRYAFLPAALRCLSLCWLVYPWFLYPHAGATQHHHLLRFLRSLLCTTLQLPSTLRMAAAQLPWH